jgi:hypothetical protein
MLSLKKANEPTIIESSDPIESQVTVVREEVEGQGLTIMVIEGDGNCFYGSFSDQLFHDDGVLYQVIQDDLCDYILSNRADFWDFL